MRYLRPIVSLIPLALLGSPGLALAQVKHIPKCTIASGSKQVHTEGGDCGIASDGEMVILTDATSGMDCGDSCGGSAGGGSVPNLCIYRVGAVCLEPMTDLGAFDIEDLGTQGTGGTVPMSDGAGDLDMTDVATQAELDAATLFAETYQGELFYAQDALGDAADADTWIGDKTYSYPIVYTEEIDALGNWTIESQGDLGSDDWNNDSVICWMPPYTHRIWMNKHCEGTVSDPDYSIGRLCASSSDCESSATCADPTWDNTASPDQITITGHDYGATDTVFPHPLRLRKGHAGAPVHTFDATNCNDVDDPVGCCTGPGTGPDCALSSAFPTCSPTISASVSNWAVVVDANTIELNKDDGDCVAEPVQLCTGSGEPYACCTGVGAGASCDQPYECSDTSDWQSLTLRVDADDCSAYSHDFYVNVSTGANYTIASGTGLACIGGGEHGTACSTLWDNDSSDCGGDSDGDVCMDIIAPIPIQHNISINYLEGMDLTNTLYDSKYQLAQAYDDRVAFTSTAVIPMNPGQCLIALGYLLSAQTSPQGGLDTMEPLRSSVLIAEASRSSPERTACNFSTSGSVGASCLRFGHLTNSGAAGPIELELPPFEVGMNFTVTNESGYSFSVDPNGSERFLSPATDANGDKLTSVVEGDSIWVYVPVDGEARVIFNSGGWADDGA